jgi:hypothetical protein
LLWRDASLAETKLLLKVAAADEEVGDAVLGVGEPALRAAKKWKGNVSSSISGVVVARSSSLRLSSLTPWESQG